MAEEFESEMKAQPVLPSRESIEALETLGGIAADEVIPGTTGFRIRQRPAVKAGMTAEPARCSQCGFPLIPREGEVCHRCRSGSWEHAREDWASAQVAWEHARADRREADVQFTDAERAREVAGEVWRQAVADWEHAQQREAAASALDQQREVEWEQAQTAWGEAQEAHAERERRQVPQSGDLNHEERV